MWHCDFCVLSLSLSLSEWWARYGCIVNITLLCISLSKIDIKTISPGKRLSKRYFGPNLTFLRATVTFKIRSGSLKSNKLFLPFQKSIYASLVKIHRLVQKITSGKVYRTVTLKIRSRSPKSNQLFIMSQRYNTCMYSLARIYHSVQDITSVKAISILSAAVTLK